MEELSSISFESNNKQIKNFNLISENNKKYTISIQIELNSNLSIVAKESKKNKEYYEYYSIDDLKNISKYFMSLDTMDEIYEEIKDKIEKMEPSIVEEKNILKLVLKTGHTKFKEIFFDLQEKELNVTEKFNELCLIRRI